jgi:hypothetical protein
MYISAYRKDVVEKMVQTIARLNVWSRRSSAQAMSDTDRSILIAIAECDDFEI